LRKNRALTTQIKEKESELTQAEVSSPFGNQGTAEVRAQIKHFVFHAAVLIKSFVSRQSTIKGWKDSQQGRRGKRKRQPKRETSLRASSGDETRGSRPSR